MNGTVEPSLNVSLRFEISMITADFELTFSSKNQEMFVDGHEFYVKRLNNFTSAWNYSKYQSYN